MNKRFRASLAFACAIVGLFAMQALAVPPGHVTDTVGALHYNIDNVRMFGGGIPPATVGPPAYVGGPCITAGGGTSLYACGFGDGVLNAATPYAWETAIQNPNAGILTAKVGFFYPAGTLLGTLTLAPGSAFHVGIIVNDALIGEIGNRLIWYSWRAPGGTDILTSAAVIEGAHAIPFIGPGDGVANTHGEFWYHFHSDPIDNFVVDPTLDINDLDYAYMHPDDEEFVLSMIPEPAAIGLLALGCVGLVSMGRRRRD